MYPSYVKLIMSLEKERGREIIVYIYITFISRLKNNGILWEEKSNKVRRIYSSYIKPMSFCVKERELL